MNDESISGHRDFNTKDPNAASIDKTGQIRNQPEKRADDSVYSSSSIQKSSAESIVLTLASGLPVLQPPSKTQTKNRYEASSNVAGGSAGSSGAQVPTEALTQAPQLVDNLKSVSGKSPSSEGNHDTAINEAKDILAILIQRTHETDQLSRQEAALQQLNRLILSALALKLLYFEFYGGMTGQEFADLIDGSTENIPQPIKGVIDQFKIVINENLPTEVSARQDIMNILRRAIDRNDSTATIRHAMSMLIHEVGGTVQSRQKSVLSKAPIPANQELDTEQMNNTIISSMWQTYKKNLMEFSERMQGNDITQWLQGMQANDAKSPTEYYALLLARSSTLGTEGTSQTNALTEAFTQTFDRWINEPNIKLMGARAVGDISQVYPSPSFLAGCVICGADILREAMRDTSSELGLQSPKSPIADVLFALGPLSNVSVDYQAAAALIAALLSNGAAYKATDDTLNKNKNKDRPPNDIDFAINYAKHIIAIVTYKPTAAELANKIVEDQHRLVRLMLLVMALNLLYRAAYGGMTGEEFASILKGETGDIAEKIKPLIDQLAGLIKANLPKNEKTRTESIIKLMDYVDTKDSIDSMLQSTRLLSHLLPTKDMEQKRWEAQSG